MNKVFFAGVAAVALFSGSAFAGNLSSIEQLGDYQSAYASVTQVGTDNVSSVSQKAVGAGGWTGGNIGSATINQAGAVNVVTAEQRGADSNLTVDQDGSNNTSYSVQSGYGATIDIDQNGHDHVSIANQYAGGDSLIVTNQSGLNNFAHVTQDGAGGETSFITQQGLGGVAIVTQSN